MVRLVVPPLFDILLTLQRHKHRRRSDEPNSYQDPYSHGYPFR